MTRVNHDDWFDLIPYYVNRSLSGPERAAFEQHLARCPMCRQRIEEWRWIAHTVYQDVAGWVQQTPPLASEVRAAIHTGPAPSANGHSTSHGEATVVIRAQRPSPSPRALQLPLTMAAAAIVIVIVGALLVYRATRPDDLTPGSEGQVEYAPPTTSGQPTVTPIPMLSPATAGPATAHSAPVYTSAPDLGILGTTAPTVMPPTTTPISPYGIGSGAGGASGAGGGAASDANSVPAIWPTETACQALNMTGGQTAVYQMPNGTIIGYWPENEWLTVFQRTSTGWYQLIRSGRIWGWVSNGAIVLDGPCESVPYPTPTGYHPPATPTAAFGGLSGMGFILVMTETVGAIPAGSEVRLSHYWFDGDDWRYVVVMRDNMTTAEARAWQLTYSPNYIPGPTPTARFDNLIGDGYGLIMAETVDGITAGTTVRISHAYFDGFFWHYAVVDENGLATEVQENQLLQIPMPPTPSPVSYFEATPTNVFWTFVGTGNYRFVTREQIGVVPANAIVRIDEAWFPGDEWRYNISTQDGLTATARQSQIRYPPPEYFQTPSPTWVYSPTPSLTPLPSQTAGPPVVINQFSATPNTGAPGASVTLAWKTTNATTVSIRPTFDGAQWYYDLPAQGSLAVTLPATANTRVTYLLIASNATGQQVNGQVTVSIGEAAP